MKRVEHMVAEAEATVTSTDDMEDIHVSDVSSSDEYNDMENDKRRARINTSGLLSIVDSRNSSPSSSASSLASASSSSSSAESLFGITAKNHQKEEEEKKGGKPQNVVYTTARSPSEDMMDIHRMPTPITSGSSVRSLMDDMRLEAKNTTASTNTNTATSTSMSATKSSYRNITTPRPTENMKQQQQQKSQSKLPPKHVRQTQAPPQAPPPPPQDRSVTSKVSASSSTATPAPYIHENHDPIISPPFTLTSPARSRNGRSNTSTNTRNSRYYYKKEYLSQSERKPFTKRGNSTGSAGSSTRRGVGTREDNEHNIILSPPKPKSAIKSSNQDRERESSHTTIPTTSTQTRSTDTIFHDMKQEIEELRIQFKTLDQQSKIRRSNIKNKNNKKNDKSKNLDESLEEDLDVMEQKTNAMADALHRNYVRSDQLQRENDDLRDECRNLKQGTNQNNNDKDWLFDSGDDDDDNNNNNDGGYDHDLHKNNDDDEFHLEKENKKSPETLLRQLDYTDEYVKRKYPPVPKTPGTMFATEFVEVMKLDVGEHAYLAEIMDRQWRTSTDYRH